MQKAPSDCAEPSNYSIPASLQTVDNIAGLLCAPTSLKNLNLNLNLNVKHEFKFKFKFKFWGGFGF